VNASEGGKPLAYVEVDGGRFREVVYVASFFNFYDFEFYESRCASKGNDESRFSSPWSRAPNFEASTPGFALEAGSG